MDGSFVPPGYPDFTFSVVKYNFVNLKFFNIYKSSENNMPRNARLV
jgi:hypothetical protein